MVLQGEIICNNMSIEQNKYKLLIVDKSHYNKEISEKLNILGKEGWELAGVAGKWFYFKREII